MSGPESPAGRAAGRPGDEGAIAVEFALLAPLFLLLVFGVMAFAIYFTTVVAVVHGAAEGARASVGGLDESERSALADARVRQIFEGYSPLLDAGAVTVTTAPAAAAGAFEVEVAYPLQDMPVGPFHDLLAMTTGAAPGRPQAIRRAVTVANGGY